MDGTSVLTLIEALLILLTLLISKAVTFISPSLYGDQLVAVDDSSQDDVILTQTVSPPPSHIVVSPPATKYDIFLSFRGEDVRYKFASHLYKGLHDAGIDTFMDHELIKGEQISEVLLRKIEESEISVIIFSKNYASSTWCLDELVHILECKEKFGRDVIPIFYNVDPSNIHKQNGSFGKGFNVLKQRFKDNPKKMQKWRDALIQSASLSGWDSNSVRPEFKLIEEIVKDILSKLNYKPSYHLKRLVGIACHIRNIENLLIEAHIVEIWGMGGASKTTLAKAIFQVLRDQFNAFSFIENVKEKLKRISLDELQKNCLQELLDDKDISIYDIKSTYVKKRLGHKKVLIILDDVDNAIIAEDLTEVLDWCGEGSRLIITSRDMQVLQNAYVRTKPRSPQATYHVQDLDFHDAIHLFSLKAFKQHEPFEGYMELSKSFVTYCQGNPLALIVLGCFLYGRRKEHWGSALEKLNQDLPENIVDVLKLSFDGLDEKQQNLFLDLAFLINERIYISLNLIRQLYDSSAPIEISVLTEKSLISFGYYGCIVMHDIVKKMGLKIARNQFISDAKAPIRLWWHEDIGDFFNRGKGIEAIRCLSLDVNKVKRITLMASIFWKMRNLVFLKIYKSDWRKLSMLNIHGVLNYLLEELRFLSWEECPLTHVPLHFCAADLIELKTRNSNIRQLWNGNQQFPNLEEIDLSDSKHLTALPDLSYAPKIQQMYLDGCMNLAQIHSSTFPVDLCILSIKGSGVVQIKVGGSIKARSSGLVFVSSYIDLCDLLFNKMTVKMFVCGNMICGFRCKHEVMPLEEIEELRKLGSLLPFVGRVECLQGAMEFGHDLNQHYHYCCDHFDFRYLGKKRMMNNGMEERGDRGEMLNEHQVVTMSLMEDDAEDDVLMEDCCSKSVVVTFTRVPNSITRWSLLTKLTLKPLPLSHHEYCRRIKPLLDVTHSFPDNIPPSPLRKVAVSYDMDVIQQHGFTCPYTFGFEFSHMLSSLYSDHLVVRFEDIFVANELEAWIKRKKVR